MKAQLTELRWSGARPDADARGYHCEPPMPWTDWQDEPACHREADYVIVSAAVVCGNPETYIFPAEMSPSGVVITSWGELSGSYRGGLDHERALNSAGYLVVR